MIQAVVNGISVRAGSSEISEFEGIRKALKERASEEQELNALKELKLHGVEFDGVMCSATKDDQDGLLAVLLAFQMQGEGFRSTIYEFANGSRLRITAENIQQFIGVWMPFRQSFFADGGSE